MRPTAIQRFWSRVKKDGDRCWLWQGAAHERGYGRFYHKGWTVGAHRFSWHLHNGPVPEGKHVLHHCDTPACVHPDHLWLGTALDNVRDAIRKGRAACRYGHKLTVENVTMDGDVMRCRTCAAKRNRALRRAA